MLARGSGGGSGHAATSRDVLDAACVCRPRPLRRPRSGRGSVFASYPLPLTSYPTGAWRWATSSRRRRSSGAASPRTRASSAASPEPMLRRLTPLPGSVVPRAARAGLEMHVLCRAGAHHGQRRRRRHLRGFSAAAAAVARPRKAAAMPLLPDLARTRVKIYFPSADVFSDPHTCVLHRGASGLGPPKFVISFHKRKKTPANGVRSSAFSRCSRRRRTRIQATLRSQRHSSAIGIRVVSKTSRGAGALRSKTVALSCEQGV